MVLSSFVGVGCPKLRQGQSPAHKPFRHQSNAAGNGQHGSLKDERSGQPIDGKASGAKTGEEKLRTAAAKRGQSLKEQTEALTVPRVKAGSTMKTMVSG